MDGATLQARIYAGYGKAASRVGRSYEVYRAATPVSPLEAGNMVGSVDCFFAADQKFNSVHKYKNVERYMWADGRELQQRDILLGPYGTFYVGDMQPNMPIQAIWCNEVVNIERPTYQGTTMVPEQIAFGLPCFRQLKKVDQKPVGQAFVASTAATPIGEWFVYLPIEQGLVQQGDLVTDQLGRTFSLDTIDNTEIGVVITMRQSDTAE
jgi:hypothetical protein